MPDLKQLQKQFITNEENPFLLVFVLNHLHVIKQEAKEYEEIDDFSRILIKRHVSLLAALRPELDQKVYGILDADAFRCLLKKRKRGEDMRPATADATATLSTSASVGFIVDADGTTSPADSAAMSLVSQPVTCPSVESAWLVNGKNVASLLSDLRNNAVALKENNKKITAIQKLMLNYVFFTSSMKACSVTKLLPSDIHAYLTRLNKRPFPCVPGRAQEWVRDLKEIYDCHYSATTRYKDDLISKLRSKTFDCISEAVNANDDNLLVYANVLNDIVLSHKRWCQDDMAKTMLVYLLFSPLVKHTMEHLNADVFRIDMQDKQMNTYCLKPDFLLSVITDSAENLGIFAMEAETPQANKGDVGFLKLGNTLKLMVDELVSRGCGLESAHSFGALMHDGALFMYEMALVHDGVYIYKEICRMPLPCSFEQLDLMLPAINAMQLITGAILENVESIVSLPSQAFTRLAQRPSNWRVREEE